MENAVHVQLNNCYVTSMQSLKEAAPLEAPVTPSLIKPVHLTEHLY